MTPDYRIIPSFVSFAHVLCQKEEKIGGTRFDWPKANRKHANEVQGGGSKMKNEQGQGDEKAHSICSSRGTCLSTVAINFRVSPKTACRLLLSSQKHNEAFLDLSRCY